MNADEKKLVRIAERHGAKIEQSKVHCKVWDGTELVMVLSHGSNKGGDTRRMRTLWKRRGWLS